jgi:sugar/nucleoside kinase (ribokinase family)
VRDELGGSALYFALAASLITPVRVVAPVGREDADAVRAIMGSRPIDLEHLAVVDAPTYRWRARQTLGRNIDQGNQDSIYDHWRPVVPVAYSGWAFAGSMRPDRQAQAVAGLESASILAADAMLSYVRSQPAEAREVLGRARWYFCNHEEFGALGGADPQEFRSRWALEGLVVKAGSRGVTAYTAGETVQIPALTSRPVVDTTGAGDAIAAGMLARWAVLGGTPSTLEEALVWGVACASITISDIGLRAIAAATREQVEERVEEVKQCMRRES